MFNKLTDLAHVRNFKEAVGFYLAYILVGLLVSMVCAMIVIAAIGADADNAYTLGFRCGSTAMMAYVIVLALLVARSKKLFRSFGCILLVLLSGILAMFGIFVGLLPVAYLTTKPVGVTKKAPRGATAAEKKVEPDKAAN